MKIRTKWTWQILPAIGIVCIWAVISGWGDLAEADKGAQGSGATPGMQAEAQLDAMSTIWQPASFFFWTREDCEFLSCHQGNPYTLYGILAVPTDPEDRRTACTKMDVIEGTCTTKFPMSGNDAILIGGRTISDAMYFNFILNQDDRWDGEGGREMTESSIGLGINHLTLNTLDPDPFGARFMMIVTASTTTATILKNALMDFGFPAEMINEDLFHRDFANGHMGEMADNLAFMYRISSANEAILDEYITDPPVSGWIVRGATITMGDVVSVEEWVPRSDMAEWGGGDDLFTLLKGIVTYYWPEYEMPDRLVIETSGHIDPEDCRGETAHPEKCHYDNPDSLYNSFRQSGGALCTPYLDDEDDFVMIVGVNHHLYGIETYFSYFINRERDMFPIAGFLGVDVVGSARRFWPETGDQFFAYKVALNCHGDPWCLELPTGEDGIEPGERFFVSGRTYLDPVSMTGPDPDNFVPAYLLWYEN